MRNIRKQKNLPQREVLTLEVIADANYPADYAPVLTKMANLSAIERVAEKDAAADVPDNAPLSCRWAIGSTAKPRSPS